MDMNKHIVKNDDEGATPFHTHGFAKVASGNNLGAVSTTSFNERIQIESSRKLVGDYKRSALGSAHNLARPKVVRSSVARSGINLRSSPRRGGGVPARGFREPPSRGYNPYA